MKEDDFFAPRPKLSWRMRLIRASALLAAIAISVVFLIVEWLVVTGPQTMALTTIGPASNPEKLLWVVLLTLAQIVSLLPCWRAWLLRQWACFFVLIVWLGIFLLCLTGLAVMFLLLPLILFYSFVVADEWHNLESGF